VIDAVCIHSPPAPSPEFQITHAIPTFACDTLLARRKIIGSGAASLETPVSLAALPFQPAYRRSSGGHDGA